MNAQKIMETDEFKQCEAFHGHVCPGLSIGFRAAREAMERLKENRSEDEEIVAVVETDACYVDAVQVLTGCTFGKGNFVYRDHGKMVLTLLSRKTGEGVRVAMRPGAFSPDEMHMKLLSKVMKGEADQEETNRFHELHMKRACDVLEMPADELFMVNVVKLALPAKATIEPSEPCGRCGEPTMGSRLETVNGEKICRDCL